MFHRHWLAAWLGKRVNFGVLLAGNALESTGRSVLASPATTDRVYRHTIGRLQQPERSVGSVGSVCAHCIETLCIRIETLCIR